MHAVKSFQSAISVQTQLQNGGKFFVMCSKYHQSLKHMQSSFQHIVPIWWHFDPSTFSTMLVSLHKYCSKGWSIHGTQWEGITREVQSTRTLSSDIADFTESFKYCSNNSLIIRIAYAGQQRASLIFAILIMALLFYHWCLNKVANAGDHRNRSTY